MNEIEHDFTVQKRKGDTDSIEMLCDEYEMNTAFVKNNFNNRETKFFADLTYKSKYQSILNKNRCFKKRTYESCNYSDLYMPRQELTHKRIVRGRTSKQEKSIDESGAKNEADSPINKKSESTNCAKRKRNRSTSSYS